ncbi:uncharacterized protein LOC113866223 [Abrus precatorius]|uniref:Uncharacterized protein LOC113866223 n=1 Tax=Abrus precatorius TaxID=3816 RepID=A0A8B8LKI9_ABRPR|nr:uncharacterized protein LOC113866223 [Abrus precatorius]
MCVALLHPQDCFTDKTSHQTTITSGALRMKISKPNPKPLRSNRKKLTHPNPQNRSDQARPTSTSPVKPQDSNKLVMGQVKILKRGEQFPQATPNRRPKTATVEKELSSTSTLTDKPDGPYAGYSMSVISPSPNSVPLPLFITRNFAALSDATSEIRKILRIEFP